jgi:hypothetical protein
VFPPHVGPVVDTNNYAAGAATDASCDIQGVPMSDCSKPIAQREIRGSDDECKGRCVGVG